MNELDATAPVLKAGPMAARAEPADRVARTARAWSWESLTAAENSFAVGEE